jgi:hypothetical protein
MGIECLHSVRRQAPENLVFKSECDAGDSRDTGTIGHIRNGRELGELRPWPYDAHFTFENVEKLRKFIKFELPQKSPQRGDAGVSFGSQARAWILANRHGAEFQHLEEATTYPYAFLAKKGRSRRSEPNGARDEQHWK